MPQRSARWDSLAKVGDKKAILSALHDACDSISKACDAYAKAIDDARSHLEEALVGAGIAVAVTSIVGVLLTQERTPARYTHHAAAVAHRDVDRGVVGGLPANREPMVLGSE
ncbi:MAG: hypothetical protein ACRDQ5_15650 [Sciscionella sp.]